MTVPPDGFVSVGRTFPWPSFLPQPEDLAFLDRVGVQVLETDSDANRIYLTSRLLFQDEIVLSLPGLDAVAITIAAEGGGTVVPIEVQIEPDFFVRVADVPVALRLKSDLFKPVRRVGNTAAGEPPRFEVDPDRTSIDIILGRVTAQVDGDGEIDISLSSSIDLPPCMIGDSGIVFEARAINIHLDSTNPPPGQQAGWRGLHIAAASLYLPGELSAVVGTLSLTDCYIGNGGFSGTVSDNWAPPLAASLFGMDFTLASVDLTFRQNAFTAASIAGGVTLPFFDEPLAVEICPNMNGPFVVRVASAGGLVELTKADIFTLTVESVGFEILHDVFTAKLSGTIRPLIGAPDLDWPTVTIRELAIDSHGDVRLDGGWLDLPDQYALDFHGFQVAITKLGFGRTEDGGNWIGFSGALRLVEGLSAGASVEGLRIAWYPQGPPRLTLNGVGVEFAVPNVLSFRGSIAYREMIVAGETVHRFDGRIRLELSTIGLTIDATLVVGTANGPAGQYVFLAIYLDVDLPAGIPLWSTGLGLYGMAGLFGMNMEPGRQPEEAWYSVTGVDWYHRPQVGVTDLVTKWTNRRGSFALGAGITIGTVVDNGYAFAGKMLLVIVLPGPIVMLEGRANILKPRSSLAEEPVFRALAVLDGRAGTFLVRLDAQYKYADGGELIDIRGSVEAYFSFHDADAWHLYLGLKDPRERRIRAQIVQIFEANCYLMLDSHQLATGAWVGWDEHWSFGPLSVTLQAWIEGNAVISWRPIHLHGDLWLHGAAALSVFGFGLGLSVDARFAADVFTPYHILASFAVGISLPWPLPDFDVTITLEWGPQPTQPPIPLPLKEVAIEHLKVTESWPLPRTGAQPLLSPNYEGAGGFRQNPPPLAIPPAAAIPVVPLDCRPHLTFGRSVHDSALVGTNADLVVPERERVGDPARNEGPVELRYSLEEVAVEKSTATGWVAVARSAPAASPNPDGVPRVFGSWAPVPAMPDGGGRYVNQTKLWLWSKTAFDYTRHSGRAWDEWFGGRFEDYPCPAPLPDVEACCDFENIPLREVIRTPFFCPDEPRLRIEWQPPTPRPIREITPPVRGKSHALCLATVPPARGYVMRVLPPSPAKEVRVVVWQDPPQSRQSCVDFAGMDVGRHDNPLATPGGTITIFDRNRNPLPKTNVQPIEIGGDARRNVLHLGYFAEVTAPCAATAVEVVVSHAASPPLITAYGRNGTRVDETMVPPEQRVAHSITLHGAIDHVTIEAKQDEAFLYRLCFTCAPPPSVIRATGFDARGTSFGPFSSLDQLITARGTDMVRVDVESAQPFCLLQACVIMGPSAADVVAREELIAHLQNETARWSQEGVVLEPNTTYRLKIVTHIDMQGTFNGTFDQTEYAFFQTEGPPGLANLANPAPGDKPSALTTLTRYIRQTVPPTVPPPGVKALLPRPVYRAYDIGVEFDEDYVEQLYRLGGRDLGLYLFDNNNQPIRDAERRLLVLPNLWGRVETLTVDRSESHWVTTVHSSDCVTLDDFGATHDHRLATHGQLLDGDTFYEARLVPLLVHEAFADIAVGTAASGTGATIGRWVVYDEGNVGLPSRWEVQQAGAPPSHYVIQTRNVSGGSADPRSPNKPGTVLLRADDPALPAADLAQPSHFTDYRLSAYLRSDTEGAIGLLVRRATATTFYRFSMERAGRYRRLVRVVGGVVTTLAEDDFVMRTDQDYFIVIQTIGSSVEVYQDGLPVFAVEDASIPEGGVGLYAWSNAGARFSDVRIDDFRTVAPVPYRFRFTTSDFAHFSAQLHSFNDETWRLALPAGTAVAPESASAVAATAAPTDAEWRAFESLADRVIPAGASSASGVRVTRIEEVGAPTALLVEGSEPIDWSRATLTVTHTVADAGPRSLPRELAMTAATFGDLQPNDESIDLLVREAFDPTGVVIERREFAGLPVPGGAGAVLFADDFSADDLGLPFVEPFGDSALARYTIIDDGDTFGPSRWTATATEITQTSDILGGSVLGNVASRGTMALTGRSEWTDVRMDARLRSDGNDAIGLVFRFQDREHYYRFSIDAQRTYRRLTRNVGGVFTVLWEDNGSYTVGVPFRLVILAFGDRLIGYVNDARLFDIRDASIGAGRVGFYTWGNNGAVFQSLRVDRLPQRVVLAEPAWSDLSDVTVVTETGAVEGPAAWAMVGGVLRQTSNVHVVDATPHRPGTYALTGDATWSDVEVSVQLRSTTGGSLGVMFRYVDADNYYRFTIDPFERRLIRKSTGVVTTLWSDAVGPALNQTHAVVVSGVGTELKVVLDGTLLVTVIDAELDAGRVALYCWSNPGAEFRSLLVLDRTRRAAGWTTEDRGTTGTPSFWKAAHRTLSQGSPVGGVAPYDGTIAFAPADVPPDFVATVRLRSDTDHAIGLVFRYRDHRNHYRLTLDNAAHRRRLVKVVGGNVTVLWERNDGFIVGDPLTLTIVAAGSRLTGHVDGGPLFNVTDGELPAGRFGLFASANDGSRFERVRIGAAGAEPYTLFRDRFLESDTGDWTIVDALAAGISSWAVFEGGIRQTSDMGEPPDTRTAVPKLGTMAVAGSVSWTDIVFEATLRSLDDDTIGLVFRYTDASHFYRFSMDRARACRRLVKNIAGSFTVLWEDEVRYEQGRAYRILIAMAGPLLRVFIDGVAVCVVEDADLPAGRIGLYCWRDSDARFYDVCVSPIPAPSTPGLLDDPLWFRVVNRWTTIDEGNIHGPSNWIFDGRLRQASSIRDPSARTDVAKRGALIVGGDVRWTDYRFMARLQSLVVGSTGLLFRVVDATHYYLLLFDTPTGVALVRRSGGVFDVLWRNAARPFLSDHPYLVTIDCVGPRLAVYVDGEWLAAVEDATYAQGKIGFFTWSNPTARFGELQVWPAEWVPHFGFAGESVLASGTRLRLFSGTPSAAPPAAPNVAQRFIGGVGERGRRQFLRGLADLRLRNVRGAVEHSRLFLRDGYAPAAVRVLRKRDGTAFFVFPPVGDATLSRGEYRLTFEYRRDNTARLPDSPILSESGDRDPETAVLDIPGQTLGP